MGYFYLGGNMEYLDFSILKNNFIIKTWNLFYSCIVCSIHRDRDQQIAKLTELQRLKSQQAEHALEDFKSQVERNSSKMFDDMKKQVHFFSYFFSSFFYILLLVHHKQLYKSYTKILYKLY